MKYWKQARNMVIDIGQSLFTLFDDKNNKNNKNDLNKETLSRYYEKRRKIKEELETSDEELEEKKELGA